MRILLVDQYVTGHHEQYIRGLLSGKGAHEYVCMLPDKVQGLENCEQIVTVKPQHTLQGYLTYWKVLKTAVEKVQPDVIHLLYGDFFYRFFGFGLKRAFGKRKVIATLHSVPGAWIKRMGVKAVCKKLTRAVVHTDSLYARLQKDAVSNVSIVEYPCFLPVDTVTPEQAKADLGIPSDVPVIAALGGTRYDKGLDLLLTALGQVKKPFYLLVAGREQDIKQQQINALIAPYRERTKVLLENLSDDTYCRCLQAADMIALPYRKILTGASGPLVEGVACGKVILGTDFGSIGHIISEKHIGYLWDTDNIENMVQVLNEVLSLPPTHYDAEAEAYQRSLSVATFAAKYTCLYEQI